MVGVPMDDSRLLRIEVFIHSALFSTPTGLIPAHGIGNVRNNRVGAALVIHGQLPQLRGLGIE